MRPAMCIVFSTVLTGSLILSASAQVTKLVSSDTPVLAYDRVQGKPYSAKETETTVKTLNDGTSLTRANETLIWRDSAGRVRIERILKSDFAPEIRHVIVYDLVDNKKLAWTSERRIVSVSSLPDLNRPRTGVAPASQVASPAPPAAQPPSSTGSSQFHREELPPETVNGLHIVGYRTTRIIPTSAHSNSRELLLTNEFRWCPELGIKVSTRIDNPDGGRYSIELTDIDRSEPVPALFKPPANYEVQ
jgi:hypothetical protein